MSKFDFSKTVSGKMLAESLVGWSESLMIDNKHLPENLVDNVRGGRTLARLEKLCDTRDAIHSEYKKTKAIKASNIEKLARQVASLNAYSDDMDVELDYSDCQINEFQLYKNECAFVNGMLNSGMIEEDDLYE